MVPLTGQKILIGNGGENWRESFWAYGILGQGEECMGGEDHLSQPRGRSFLLGLAHAVYAVHAAHLNLHYLPHWEADTYRAPRA